MTNIDSLEVARRHYRALEMSAAIMRDPKRTGGWEGAERTALAFERQAETAKGLFDFLTIQRARVAELEGFRNGYKDYIRKLQDSAEAERAKVAALEAEHDPPASQVRDIPEGWQPIETAPNGITVDVWLAPRGKIPCRVPNAHRDGHRWYAQGYVRIWGEVTHWMRLPSPPAPESK